MTPGKRGNLYLDGEEKFGGVSSRFYSIFSGLATWKMYRQIVDYVVRQRPASIMDVGCGPGDVILEMASRLPDSRILGVDPSPAMIRIAGKKIEKNGLTGRVRAVIGSSRKIESGEEYDLIISSFSFHHWAKRQESISNLSQYLSSKGKLAIFDMSASGLYGKMPVVRKHALSEDYAKHLQIDGFTRNIAYTDDGRLIILSFERDLHVSGNSEAP